jgi:hypothetical protein
MSDVKFQMPKVHLEFDINRIKYFLNMKKKNNPFGLTSKEQLIEGIGIVIFVIVFVGSALKLLFF